jgi:multiple sugar transport system permease protein
MNRSVARGFAYAFLILVCVVILLPYFIMLITSIKTSTEVFAFPPRWIPAHLYLGNFVQLFTKYGFGKAFLASLVACGGSTVLTLLIATPAAYAIARLRFRGRRWIIYVFLIAQMFAPIVIIVGLFRVIVFYHLLDNLLALVLTYAAFNLAFSIWMLSSFFETIPPGIEEAAWIDGATRWGAIRSVFVPLAMPGMTVAFLFSFVMAWNDLVLALSFMRSSGNFPVTLSIFNLVSGRYTVEWQVVMAAVILATLPVVIMFGSVQRYFIQGFTAGAIK